MSPLLAHLAQCLLATVIICGPIPLAVALGRAGRDEARTWPTAHAALVVLISWCGLQTSLALALGVAGRFGLTAVAVAELGLALAGWVALRRAGDRKPECQSPPSAPGDRVGAAALLLLAGLGAGTAWQSLRTPVEEFDSLAYHLPIMAEWVQRGSLAVADHFEPMVAHYPFGWEILAALFMLPFSGDLTVLLPNLVAWTILGLAVALLGRRLGSTRLAATAAAACAMTCPVVLENLGTLHVDGPFAAFFAATVYLAADVGSRREGAAAGPLLMAWGLMLGAKASAIPYSAVPAAALLLSARTSRAPSRSASSGWRWPTAVCGAAGALCGSFWYLRNLLATGNPLGRVRVGLGPITLLHGPVDPAGLHETTLAFCFDPGLAEHWRVLLGQVAVWLGLPGVALLVTCLGLLARVLRRQSGRWPAVAILAGSAVAAWMYWHTPFTARNPSVEPGLSGWLGQQLRFAMPAVALIASGAAAAGASTRIGTWALITVALAGWWTGAAAQGTPMLSCAAAAVLALLVWTARWIRPGPGWRGRAAAAAVASGAVACALVASLVLLSARAHRAVLTDRKARGLEPVLRNRVGEGGALGFALSERIFPLYGQRLQRRVTSVQLPGGGFEAWLRLLRRETSHDPAVGADRETWLDQLDRLGLDAVAMGPVPRKWRDRPERRWLEDPDGAWTRVHGGLTEGEISLFVRKRPAAAADIPDSPGAFTPTGAVFRLDDRPPFAFGRAGDLPVAGDWDGDGIDTVGVFRDGVFLLRVDPGGGVAQLKITFGRAGDRPVAGDWNGDGIDTVGVLGATGFALLDTLCGGPAHAVMTLPQATSIDADDQPLAGDWDGDGSDAPALFRPQRSEIAVLQGDGTADLIPLPEGDWAGCRAVAGDWDLDGVDSVALLCGSRLVVLEGGLAVRELGRLPGSGGDIPLAGVWRASADPS